MVTGIIIGLVVGLAFGAMGYRYLLKRNPAAVERMAAQVRAARERL